MNSGHLRKPNPPPLTPNLQDYKKNKSKSRRKPYSIQPTNPPTPKLHKAHITLKPTTDKLAEALQNSKEDAFCPLHQDRIATHFLQSNNCSKKFCQKCYLLSRQNEDYDEEVQVEKRRELDQFKGRIKGFGLKLEQAEERLREWCFCSQKNFYSQKEYINDSFNTLRGLIEDKERQLLNQLLLSQQNLKKLMGKSSGEIEEVKKSIQRYICDIDSNYSDIIEALSYEQFNEIIEKYNYKLNYYQNSIEEIIMDTSLNVYIPRKQIEKQLEKASVQIYPSLNYEELSYQGKTQQRYPTEKNHLFAQMQTKTQSYQSHHHDSIINKMGQHRQSRDRYDYNLRQTLQHKVNKQNYNHENNLIFY